MVTMLTKSKRFAAAAALVLAFALISCGDINKGDDSEGAGSGWAEDPVITAQPQNVSVNLGEEASVSVTATVPEGALSYQWYAADPEAPEGGVAIPAEDVPSAVSSTLKITSQEEGIMMVYVIVTNTNAGVTATARSNPARIIFNDPDSAEFPAFSVEPKSAAYLRDASSTVQPLTVQAQISSASGNVTYQWYSSTTEGGAGTAIGGAEGTEYTPAIPAVRGVAYYYAVATNTDDTKSKDKVRSTESMRAEIRFVEANAFITVTSDKAQYVRGFGVMANFWSNSHDVSIAEYDRMFNPNRGLGLNMVRVMVPVDNREDPEGGTTTDMRKIMAMALDNKLSGDKDRRNYYDIVKLMNSYGGYVLASPWSPPREWKSNNNIKGGGGGNPEAKLKKEYWQDYAEYLKLYCKIMYENGAPIYAISIQNEPNYLAEYDGCEWTAEEMRTFFETVGRFTEGVKGFGGGKEIPWVLTMSGESANTPSINNAALNSPTAMEYIDLFGRHIYGNVAESVADKVHAAGKEIWMTEMNINSNNATTYTNDSTYNFMWKFANTVDVVLRLNNENAYIWWYGKRFYSFIGDGDYGTIKGSILPRGYAMSHYAKYATETDRVLLTASGTTGSGGAITVGTNFNNTQYNVDSTAVKAAAFASPDGNSYSLVMFTPTSTSGSGGIDMGDIKISFPAGFTASTATAMRTKAGAMGRPDDTTVLIENGAAALVSLPAGQILSVKFTR